MVAERKTSGYSEDRSDILDKGIPIREHLVPTSPLHEIPIARWANDFITIILAPAKDPGATYADEEENIQVNERAAVLRGVLIEFGHRDFINNIEKRADKGEIVEEALVFPDLAELVGESKSVSDTYVDILSAEYRRLKERLFVEEDFLDDINESIGRMEAIGSVLRDLGQDEFVQAIDSVVLVGFSRKATETQLSKDHHREQKKYRRRNPAAVLLFCPTRKLRRAI